MRVLALLWLCCCLAACASRGADPHAAADHEFPWLPAIDSGFPEIGVDSIVRRALRDRGIPAVSVAVMRGGEIVFARGYGVADRESGIPATAETVYGVGSISKLFTAAAVMRLVEQGRVGLDDPVGVHVSGFPIRGHTVLVRHLLQHTSGVPDFVLLPGFEAMEQGAPERHTRADLFTLFRDRPLAFAPGAGWAYSNSNYTLLGLVVEAASRSTYARFVEDDLVRPLGLLDTFSCDARVDGSGRARGYSLQDGRIVPAPFFNPNTAVGDGGICSTAVDLVRWMHALASGAAVGRESWSRMSSGSPLADGFRPDYGFGLNLGGFDGRDRLGHSGHAPGFTATLGFYPDDDLVVAVLTNQGAAWPESIEKAIVRRVLGRPAPNLRRLLLSQEGRERYAGVYDTGNFPLVVRAEAGELWIDLKGPVALEYQGGDVFVSSTDPDAVRLEFGVEHGIARRVTLEFAGMRWYATRSTGAR